MLELLFIYALSGGIQGNPTNTIDPAIFIEAEAGIRINDLYLTGSYYYEPDPYNNTADNQTVNVRLFVDHYNYEFGAEYEYSLETREDCIKIYFRFESEGWK